MKPEELRKRKDLLIIDVREPYEYEAGHIKGAVNIPVSRFTQPLELPKKEIVTVCEHGIRSSAAAKILKAKGYKAESLEGGMEAWNKQVKGRQK